MIRPRVAMLGFRSMGGPTCGGVEVHVGELAPRLARLGCDMTLFCRAGYQSEPGPVPEGVRLRTRPCLRTKHLEAVTHTGLCALESLAGFDIVHFHALGPALFSWLPRLAGRAVVVTVHGLDHRRAKWGRAASAALALGEWASARFAHKVITVSRPLAEHMRAAHGVDAVHIPNGAPPCTARALDGLRRFGIHEPGYVLFLGRLVPEKGVHMLIDAYKTLDTDRQLVIAGGPGHSEDYERGLHARARGDGRVVFTGPLFGPDKDEAFSNAGLFVLPSDIEGMPIALLEAAGHGAPLLASDLPECREAFPPDANGHSALATFNTGCADDLARRLDERLRDPGLEESGRSACEAALAAHDWDAVARLTMDVYTSLLER